MTQRFFAMITTPLLPMLISGCGLARAPLVAVDSDAGAVDLSEKIVLNRNYLKSNTPPPFITHLALGCVQCRLPWR